MLMTVREEVQKRYDELRATRLQDLNNIQAKTDVARAQLAAAEQRIVEATRETNIDAYDKAQADARKQRSAIEMYQSRLQQIQQQDYVSQQDGDAVVDSLLQYEKDLAAQFEAAILKPLQELQKMQADYAEEIRKTEQLLRLWTRDIRHNYRSFTGSTYYNAETGTHTNVSPRPLEVHSMGYDGCEASKAIEAFLTGKAREFMQE